MNEAIAKSMAIGGGGTAFVFGLDVNLFISFCGLAVSICGLGLMWYYKRKQSRLNDAQAGRDQEYHDKRMGQGE